MFRLEKGMKNKRQINREQIDAQYFVSQKGLRNKQQAEREGSNA